MYKIPNENELKIIQETIDNNKSLFVKLFKERKITKIHDKIEEVICSVFDIEDSTINITPNADYWYSGDNSIINKIIKIKPEHLEKYSDAKFMKMFSISKTDYSDIFSDCVYCVIDDKCLFHVKFYPHIPHIIFTGLI